MTVILAQTLLMHKRLPASRRIVQFCYLSLLFLGMLTFAPSCKKSKTDPCKDLLNETAPLQVAVILIDRQTGDSILLSKQIDVSTVSIKPVQTDLSSEQCYFVSQTNSPLYGAILFHIEDQKAGSFTYDIKVPNVAAFTLSYTNTVVNTDSQCHPYSIKTDTLSIRDYDFTVSNATGRPLVTISL